MSISGFITNAGPIVKFLIKLAMIAFLIIVILAGVYFFANVFLGALSSPIIG